MLQKQSLHLDESQEFECQKLKNRLQYEMDVLMAYQKKNRMQSQTQRERERKELEERVSVRRALLESKVRTLFDILPYYDNRVIVSFVVFSRNRWRPNSNNSIVSERSVFEYYTTSIRSKLKHSMRNRFERVSGRCGLSAPVCVCLFPLVAVNFDLLAAHWH